ncbi:putative Diguanylate cyclase [Leptolyngbya sp. BL0902]|uniref:putative bifunctional diguanylate cyclase/phosphodiesterase n=1 Tax=Leptolyngbya sp. BL0902 TaxID=1115757 RepID=UPI0018E7A5B1|nr:EAL domain-containing protein [Leptolyngbya sp. BL0902]QQE66567.1 putative Diguanylate cyclase [Leptolyngbya sp. BL0902]
MANATSVPLSVRPEVLGRLLVIPSMLDVLPDSGAMAVFLGAALREIPGVAQVSLCVEGIVYPSQGMGHLQPSPTLLGTRPSNPLVQQSFPLSSPRHQYGHLLLGIDAEEIFYLYRPYVSNIANIVATVLENRAFLRDIQDKNRRLQDLLTHLEERVENRTQELTNEIAYRKQLEQELRTSNEQLELAASVFTHAREGILITDALGTILDVNKAFTHITGYSREEALGRNPRLLKSGLQEAPFYRAMWRDLADKGYWCGEIWNRRKDGEVYAELLTISAVCDAEGQTQRYVALFSNITLQKIHQQELEHIAHYDALTSLPNRVLLADRLHQAMAQAMRHRQCLAVAYIDLDGFKAVNDNHGHEAGDYLLITVAKRMTRALRQEDTLARLGGDEFVAVMLDVGSPEGSQPILQRILSAAAQPVQWGGDTLQVSASLGATFYPQLDPIDADQLLRQADQAMYQAKTSGKNRCYLFDTDGHRSAHHRRASLDQLRQALAQEQFELYYQPKVNMGTGQVLGAEALIRWQHPDQGLLLPAQFLPALAEHPLATDVGEWVIATALDQLAQWHGAGLPLTISVNLEAQHLQQPDFVARLTALLAAYPAALAQSLEIEVIETNAIKNLDRMAEVIEACQAMGVQFALDDFGTGSTSLAHLKQLPVAQVKIDQSFVRNMLRDPQDLAIIEGVIDLAQVFRRQVVAEGVETLAHGKLLLQLGCELAQGYSIARPMPAVELLTWLETWKTAPVWRRQHPLNRDDWPLLLAHLEISTWVKQLVAPSQRTSSPISPFRPTLPPGPSSRLEIWFNGPGKQHYGHHPHFHNAQKAYQALAQLGHRPLTQATSPTLNPGLSKAEIQHLRQIQRELLGYLKALGHLSHRR